MTLIVVPDIITLKPLSRSQEALDAVVQVFNHKSLTADKIQEDFARYIASVLRARIQYAVRYQVVGKKSMKSLYKPLSEAYVKTKIKAHKDKFYVNTNHLIQGLKLFKTGNQWRIGYRNSDRHPVTGVKIINLLLFLEKGTKSIPPRPLVIPHAKYISKNIMLFYKHYIKLRFGIKL